MHYYVFQLSKWINISFNLQEWGSDHLALVCELAFMGEGSET